jgi:hypothetical protein
VLTYFTVTSSLPRIVGTTTGMGLALAAALATTRATGTAPDDATIGAWAARNCIPTLPRATLPLGGRALLDILV